MTVGQLIQKLQKLPPNTLVVVRGYEDGYNPISDIKRRNLIPHPGQNKEYYGEFADGKSGGIEAVEIFGFDAKATD